jgi:hypothetical protein
MHKQYRTTALSRIVHTKPSRIIILDRCNVCNVLGTETYDISFPARNILVRRCLKRSVAKTSGIENNTRCKDPLSLYI